jgi:hypothetical protein
MAQKPFGYWDYVKAAFRHPHPIPLLGRMPVNQMGLLAFGLLGFVNPGFWLLGAAAELSYLGLLSTNQRFQRLVKGEQLVANQRGAEEVVTATLARLTPDAQARYRRLLAECARILGIAPAARQSETGTLEDLRAGSLNSLLALFLRLLVSQQLIRQNLAQVDPRTLEAEIEELKARHAAAAAGSPLARSLEATLDIQGKRLANLERARSSLEVIDAELERIEQQVRLIREESAVSGGPELLSARLDAVTQTLAETSRWMDQNAELFGAIAGDELGAGGPLLPRLEGPLAATPGSESPDAPASTPPPRRGRERA